MVSGGKDRVEDLVLHGDVFRAAVLGVLGWKVAGLFGIPCVGTLVRRRPVVAERYGEETHVSRAFLFCRSSRKYFRGVYT